MGVQDDAERFQPASVAEWSTWLAAHHADARGVWLVTYKSSSGLATFDYEEAIVEARRRLWAEHRIASEHGAATAYAALLSGAYSPADGERVCVVVCGANTDPSTLA